MHPVKDEIPFSLFSVFTIRSLNVSIRRYSDGHRSAVNRTRHQMKVPGAFVPLLLLMSTIGCATVRDRADMVVQPKPPKIYVSRPKARK